MRPKAEDKERASHSPEKVLSLLGLTQEERRVVLHRASEASPVLIGGAQVDPENMLSHLYRLRNCSSH